MGDTPKYDDEDPFDWLVFCPSCGAYTELGPDGKPTCNHGYEHEPASSPAGHREHRIRIETAADHLDLIPTVAGWHWAEWGRVDPKGSVESWVEALMTKTNRDRVPATWIAMFDDLPVGSVSLVEHDMPDRPELAAMSPWLAGLYVLPTHRRLGIATQFVTACESEALRMGIARVYLYSSTARPLYERLRWERLADDFYEGESITIMAKDLNSAKLSGTATA